MNESTKLPDCTVGRTGPLCAVCSDGYYANDALGCERCPSGADSATEFVGMLMLLFALVAAAFKLKSRVQQNHPRLYASMSEKLPEVAKLLTGLFQILGAFAAVLYRVPWPAAFQQVTAFTSLLALDMFALPSLRCSNIGSSFYGRFNVHMASMLIFTGLFIVLLFYAYSRYNQTRASPLRTSLVWNLFLTFLFVIYPSISRTTILMLRCTDVDGSSYLLTDISISCETDRYARHKIFAAWGVVIFPVGILVFFTSLVAYYRHKLPPDWWPAHEPERARLSYQKYRSKRTEPKSYGAWKIEAWLVQFLCPCSQRPPLVSPLNNAVSSDAATACSRTPCTLHLLGTRWSIATKRCTNALGFCFLLTERISGGSSR